MQAGEIRMWISDMLKDIPQRYDPKFQIVVIDCPEIFPGGNCPANGMKLPACVVGLYWRCVETKGNKASITRKTQETTGSAADIKNGHS